MYIFDVHTFPEYIDSCSVSALGFKWPQCSCFPIFKSLFLFDLGSFCRRVLGTKTGWKSAVSSIILSLSLCVLDLTTPQSSQFVFVFVRISSKKLGWNSAVSSILLAALEQSIRPSLCIFCLPHWCWKCFCSRKVLMMVKGEPMKRLLLYSICIVMTLGGNNPLVWRTFIGYLSFGNVTNYPRQNTWKFRKKVKRKGFSWCFPS